MQPQLARVEHATPQRKSSFCNPRGSLLGSLGGASLWRAYLRIRLLFV